MLKRGIFSSKQLTRKHLEGFLNCRKCIALDLYDFREEHQSIEEREKIQERILSRFANGNHTYRVTYQSRFDDFDAFAIKHITDHFPVCQTLRVHDIGASDGRTSCHFYDRLDRLYGKSLDFTASDREPHLYVLRRKNSVARLIVDSDNNVLQIIAPPFVLNIARPDRKLLYPVNLLMRHALMKFYARPLVNSYRASGPTAVRTKLELLSNECRAYVASKTNFQFEKYDLLKGPTRPFHIIRIMNLLNPSYFVDAQLSIAIRNVIQSLLDQGLFITGSNQGAGTPVNGAIYQKVGNRLDFIARSGEGSPIDQLIRNQQSDVRSGPNAPMA